MNAQLPTTRTKVEREGLDRDTERDYRAFEERVRSHEQEVRAYVHDTIVRMGWGALPQHQYNELFRRLFELLWWEWPGTTWRALMERDGYGASP